MKAEKVILSFVAIIVGLVAAGIAFYFYQMTKVVPEQKDKTVNQKIDMPSPTPDTGNFLTIAAPTDEAVFSKKVITINGKTESNATIIVSTEDSDQVVTPAANGDFSLTQTIPSGTSLLHITAIFQNGEEKTITKTVTFSSENF